MTDQNKHLNLAAALAAFHTEAPKIIKDSIGKVNTEKAKYTYGYADLAQVTEALNPLLGKHGLTFVSKPTMTDQGFGLVYKLKHESGEEEEGFWPLPAPGGIKPQDLGSFITYWRRYAFLAVTNTFPSGEDDDGAVANASAARPAMTPEQFDSLPRERPGRPASAPTSPAATGPAAQPTPEQFRNWFDKLDTLPLDQAGKFYDWMGKKGLHNQEFSGKTGTRVLVDRLTAALGNPQIPLHAVDSIRALATERGLLNQQVAPDGTSLGQVIIEVRELAQHEADTAQAPAEGA